MGVTATAVFSTNSMFHFPAFPKRKTGITIPKEIVYSPLVNTIRKDSRRSTVSVIRADGNRQWNRRPPKDATPEKTSKGDEINMLTKKKKGDEINMLTKKKKGDEINMLTKKKKGDEINIQSSPDSKSSQSSNKEEIISVFKRIQTSITKGDSSSSKKRSSKSPGDQKPNIDAVLEILRDSSALDYVTTANTTDEQQGLTHQRGQREPKTEDSTTVYPRPARPPSKFVKRSPIQSPINSNEKVEQRSPIQSPFNFEEKAEQRSPIQSPINSNKKVEQRSPIQSPFNSKEKAEQRSPIQSPINSNGKVEQRSPIQSPFNTKEKAEQRSPIQSPFNSKEKVELKTEEASSAANHPADEVEAVKFEEMKVAELKEVAKSRGLKGYSKMKKSELVELLIRC